jgi:hypothetical protein
MAKICKLKDKDFQKAKESPGEYRCKKCKAYSDKSKKLCDAKKTKEKAEG